jgi:HSP20 family protein
MFPQRFTIQPYSSLRNEMDSLFDDFLGQSTSYIPNGWGRVGARRQAFPALNIWENQESYFVEAECPGLKIEDIDLSITGNQLSLSAERKEELVDDVTYHRQERGTTKFSRMLTLPSEIELEKVEATLKDGVLTLRLPKAPSAKPKKIAVKSQD